MSEDGDWISRLTDFTAQIGPYVEAKCDKAAEEAAKAIGKFTGESAAGKIAQLWDQLRGRLAGRGVGKALLEEIAASPEDEDNIEDLKSQIRRLLKNDPEFRAELQQLYQQAGGSLAQDASIRDIGQLSYGFLVTGDNNRLRQINQNIEGDQNLAFGEIKDSTVTIHDQRGATIHPSPEKPSAERVLKQYLRCLSVRCTDMPLQQLVNVDIRDRETLKNLYVPLKVFETPREQDPVKFRQPIVEARFDRTEAVVDVVDRHRCMVLLGEPGAGKSTFVRHLTRQLLKKESAVPADLRSALPVLIELRTLVKYWPENDGQADIAAFWQAFESSLSDQFGLVEETASAVADHLREIDSERLLILDGLDEFTASARRRESLCRTVERLATGTVRVLVTARP